MGTQSHGTLEVSRATERKQSTMGDLSAVGSFYDEGATTVDFPVPPQVLARWAALASERACFGVLPTQVLSAV